jgi:hypothetical protein
MVCFKSQVSNFITHKFVQEQERPAVEVTPAAPESRGKGASPFGKIPLLKNVGREYFIFISFLLG